MKKGFTLIELLVVIGLFVVILTIILYFFNPIEFAKRQRDIKRINDLNSLASAIETCISIDPNCSLGPDERGYEENYPTIFISAPLTNDIISTATDAIGKFWLINAVEKENIYNINGSGWLPVNFSTLRYSPLSSLPVDPINSFSQRYFYSYVFKRNTKEFEINANLEFDEFKKDGKSDKTSKDGGSDLEIFEVGNNKCLIYNNLYGPITTSTCGYIKTEKEEQGQGGELVAQIILNNTTGTIWGLDIDDSNLYFVGRTSGGVVGENDWGVGKTDFNLANTIITTSDPFTAPYPDNPFDIKVSGESLYIGGRLAYPAPGIGDFSWIQERRDKNLNQLMIATSNPQVGNGTPDSINALAVDSNNEYFVGKECIVGNCKWRIEKRGSNLEYISAITSDPSSGEDEALDIALDDKYIYIVGYQYVYSPVTSTAWRIEKRDKDLNLVTSTVYDTSQDDGAEAIVIYENYLYIAGYEGGNWRIEKRDKDLNLVWATTSNPTGYLDIPFGIAADCEGIYIAGAQSYDSNPYWRIEKRDFNGNLVFSTTSSYGIAYDIAVNDSGIFIAGYKGTPNRWAIEKRSRGAPKCKTIFLKEITNEALYEAATTTDGYYVMAGEIFLGSASGSDAVIEKFDREGNRVGQYTFGGIKNDVFNSIIVDGDYYIAAGRTYSFGTGTPTTSNAYFVKIDKNGNKIWEKYFDFIYGDDYINQVKKDEDGNYIAVGRGIIVKISSSGNIIYSQNIEAYLNSVDITNDKNYIVGGIVRDGGYIGLINSSTGMVNCSSTIRCYYYNCNLQYGVEKIIQTLEGYYLGLLRNVYYQSSQDPIWLAKANQDCTYSIYTYSPLKGYSIYPYIGDIIQIVQDKILYYIMIFPYIDYTTNKFYFSLIKCDSSLNCKRIQDYNLLFVDYSSIIQTPDDGYLILAKRSFGGLRSYIIKTDKYGNTEFKFAFNLKNYFPKFVGNIYKSLKALFYKF